MLKHLIRLAVALPISCTGGDRADSGRAHPDSNALPVFPFVRAREYPFFAPTVPVRFETQATGPRFDSTRVTLRLLAADGHILYERTWPGREYFECDDNSCSPDTVTPSRGQGELFRRVGQLLGDSAFQDSTARNWPWRAQENYDAIHHELATQLIRSDLSLGATDSLPPSAVATLRARPAALWQRADSLMQELRQQPLFTYETGLTYCVLAASPTAKRVFEVLCGP